MTNLKKMFSSVVLLLCVGSVLAMEKKDKSDKLLQTIQESNFTKALQLLKEKETSSIDIKGVLKLLKSKERSVRFLTLVVLGELAKKGASCDENNTEIKEALKAMELDFDSFGFPAAAPDGSKVCPFGAIMSGASAAYCNIKGKSISFAAKHNKYNEWWPVISGNGELSLRYSDGSVKVFPLTKGKTCCIPAKTDFQFRNDGKEPIKVLLVVSPAWYSEDLEFVAPIYPDSTYKDPKVLTRNLKERNELRKILIKNLGDLESAIKSLKKDWDITSDKELFKRIVENRQNPLEHAFEMIRFVNLFHALKDNVSLEKIDTLELDEKKKVALKESYNCDSVEKIIASCMSKVNVWDEVVFYERWYKDLANALTKKGVKLGGYDSMVPALVEKILKCDSSVEKVLRKGQLKVLLDNPHWPA